MPTKIVIEPKTLKEILKYRIKGYTLESIAPIFHIKSRQMVHKIIEENRNEPEYKKLYEEIDKTFLYLNREI